MSTIGNTIVLDDGARGMFMCAEDAHGDQQISWQRHTTNGDPLLWEICSIPSEALCMALGLPGWHCWLTDAVIDDFGSLVIVSRPL